VTWAPGLTISKSASMKWDSHLDQFSWLGCQCCREAAHIRIQRYNAYTSCGRKNLQRVASARRIRYIIIIIGWCRLGSLKLGVMQLTWQYKLVRFPAKAVDGDSVVRCITKSSTGSHWHWHWHWHAGTFIRVVHPSQWWWESSSLWSQPPALIELQQ
jgi:hypothetical protein